MQVSYFGAPRHCLVDNKEEFNKNYWQMNEKLNIETVVLPT